MGSSVWDRIAGSPNGYKSRIKCILLFHSFVLRFILNIRYFHTKETFYANNFSFLDNDKPVVDSGTPHRAVR